MTATLVDTNILVYAYLRNPDEPKGSKARKIVEDLTFAERSCLSMQNLTEFSAVLLRKARPMPSFAQIDLILNELEAAFEVLLPTPQSLRLALNGVEAHQLSFWDAMLWAVAKENGVTEILSEDFNPGQSIEGVAFRNPLK